MNHLTAWKTPKGNRFFLAPLPWTRVSLLEWDQWRTWGGWPEDVPVMSTPEASRYLEEAEAYHAPHGFFVLPGWRGVRVPDSCPGMVALDLQACFLASSLRPGRTERGTGQSWAIWRRNQQRCGAVDMAHITYPLLVELEPRLLEAEGLARKHAGKDCNRTWFNTIRPAFRSLVGFNSKHPDPRVRDGRAYHVVYSHLCAIYDGRVPDEC